MDSYGNCRVNKPTRSGLGLRVDSEQWHFPNRQVKVAQFLFSSQIAL